MRLQRLMIRQIDKFIQRGDHIGRVFRAALMGACVMHVADQACHIYPAGRIGNLLSLSIAVRLFQ